MNREITLITHKVAWLAVFGLVVGLNAISVAKAETLTVQCKVLKDNLGHQRSIIAVRSTDIKGKYYVKISSGESEQASDHKSTNRRNIIDFRFDSDFSYVATHPETTLIPSDFIKKKKIVGVLRKDSNNGHVGGVSANCSARKGSSAISP